MKINLEKMMLDNNQDIKTTEKEIQTIFDCFMFEKQSKTWLVFLVFMCFITTMIIYFISVQMHRKIEYGVILNKNETVTLKDMKTDSTYVLKDVILIGSKIEELEL